MRRKLLFVACAVLLVQGTVQAGFKMPSAVFELSELEAAQKKAREKRKPIAVIFTDHTSSCGLCSSASKTIIDELDSKTIMVYLPSKLKKHPDFAKKAFKRGKYIPKVAVFDVELTKILGEVVYEDIKKDGDDAFDDVLKIIRNYRKTLPKK
jgi:hypothetical protein